MTLQSWERETKHGREIIAIQLGIYKYCDGSNKEETFIRRANHNKLGKIDTDTPIVMDILDAVNKDIEKTQSFGFERVV